MKNLLLLFLLITSFQAKAQWIGAVIDTVTHNTVRDEVNHQCLDIDGSSGLHLVYVRENSSSFFNIFYKKKINNTWSQEDSVTSETGFAPVVAAYDTGLAFVAYEGTVNNINEIFICSDSGGTWSCHQLTFDTTSNITPTIALDSAGFVHLAWVGTDANSEFKIMYATNMSGSWVIQQIAISELGMFGSGANPEIDVDKWGRAHIAYRGDNGTGYKIHHAYNTSPGDTSWSYELITTPNDEDLSCAIQVDKDTVVHLLVSGDDGFGFPVEAFYQKKAFSDTAFTPSDFVAQNYRGGVGDLFVDNDGQPHIILNEISGNILTGNIIYANPNSWNGMLLLNTTDIYGYGLVVDNEDHAYFAGYRGTTFPDYEVIVYGAQSTVGMNDAPESYPPFRIIKSDKNISARFDLEFKGTIRCMSVDGKEIFSETRSFAKDDRIDINVVAEGIYLLSADDGNKKFTTKVIVR